MFVEKVKVCSININGVSNKRSIHDSQHLILKHDIIFIQETKISNIIPINNFRQPYKNYNIFYSFSTGNSGGLITLIKKRENLAIKDVLITQNYIAIQAFVNKKNFKFINIYCPNDPTERANLLKEIDFLFLDNAEFILGGDFNFVPNIKLDKKGGNVKLGDKGQALMQILCDDANLLDIWRLRHPNLREYTWARNGVHCRLDRFYISQTIIPQVLDCTIETNPFSDHKNINLELQIDGDIRDKIWKCNSELFPIAENDILNEINNTDFSNNFWWEKFKSRVKKILIDKGKEQALEYRTALANLKKELENLINSDAPIDEINVTKNMIISIIREHNNGSYIRSRAKIFFDSERPTKLFLKQEKRNFTNNQINTLEINGIDETEPNKINNFIFDHFSIHYKKDNLPTQNHTFFDNITQITDEKAIECEKDISEVEIINAIKTLKNNSAPGGDGLTKEFYKFFMNPLMPLLKRMIKDVLLNDELFPSQKHAIIKIIPKSNDENLQKQIKMWRPISLLNVDYKIITKIVSFRIADAIEPILSKNQSCFAKRNITDNLHDLRNIIDYITEKDLPHYAILSHDYETAFDSLDHNFMVQTLEKFGFRENILRTVKIFYKDIKSYILTDHLSPAFAVERGIRQGCPLSMILFAISMEPLLTKINNMHEIKGFSFGNVTKKFIAHADDINFIVENNTDIAHIKSEIINFQNVSGLKSNQNKCNILPIGHRKYEWRLYKTVEQCKILGILTDRNGFSEQNHDKLTSKLYKTLDFWKSKHLSIKGKITIINTILAPKLWYALSILPTNRSKIRDFQRLMEKFLWNIKYPPENNKFYDNVRNGGINLTNMIEKITAFKIRHIYDLINKNPCWENLAKYWLGKQLKNENPKFKLNNFPWAFYAPSRFYKSAIFDFENFKKIITGQPTNYTIKNFYNILLRKRIGTTIPLINWKFIYNKNISARQESLNYRILAKLLPVGEWRLQRNIISNEKLAECKLCFDLKQIQRTIFNPNIESNLHLFCECPKVQILVNQILQNFNFEPLSLRTHLTHQNSQVFENKDIVMTTIIRETVWEARNSAVFDGAKFSSLQLWNNFNNKLSFYRSISIIRHGHFYF